MSSELFLNENEITKEKIIEIFNSAFYDVKLTDKGSILIEDTLETNILVSNKEQGGYLRFWVYSTINKDKDELQKLRFVNKANSERILVRFNIDDDGDLSCDYYLYYKGGLTAQQIITTYRKFVAIVMSIVDDEDLDPDCVIKSE
jgi:hypothetical protein